MRVLLIDDDPLVRQTLMDTLATEGIEVDGLANAEDALVLLGAGQVPDVLVADIDLGAGLSGLDLAAIARERHPAVQVVLISGKPPPPAASEPGSGSCASPSPPRPSPRRSGARRGAPGTPFDATQGVLRPGGGARDPVQGKARVSASAAGRAAGGHTPNTIRCRDVLAGRS